MATAYNVSQAWAILRRGVDKEARQDIAKRFPMFATSTDQEIISALELVGLRKMETWLRGEEEAEEIPTPVRKSRPVAVQEEEDKPVRRGPGRPPKAKVEEVPVKRGPGRPKRVVEPEPEEYEEEEDLEETEEDDYEEEEEEAPKPVKRGPGRPPKNNPLPTPSRKSAPTPVAKKRKPVQEEEEDFEDLDSFFDDEEE